MNHLSAEDANQLIKKIVEENCPQGLWKMKDDAIDIAATLNNWMASANQTFAENRGLRHDLEESRAVLRSKEADIKAAQVAIKTYKETAERESNSREEMRRDQRSMILDADMFRKRCMHYESIHTLQREEIALLTAKIKRLEAPVASVPPAQEWALPKE